MIEYRLTVHAVLTGLVAAGLLFEFPGFVVAPCFFAYAAVSYFWPNRRPMP